MASIDPVPVPSGPVWLGSSLGVESRYESLRDAVSAWLAQGDPLLGALPDAGIDVVRLSQAFHDAARLQDQPQLLYEPSPSGVVQPSPDAERRLFERGRLILQDIGGPIPPSAAALRRVITGWLRASDFAARQLDGKAMSTLRGSDDPTTRLRLADFVAEHSESQAAQLYRSSAERGDASAMGALLLRLARAGEADAADEWEKRLIATSDWAAVKHAALNVIGVDDILAGRLFTASAAAGDRDSMARLVGLATLDDDTRNHWEEQLVGHDAWAELRQLGLDLERSDPGRSNRLLAAAADGGDLDAIEELMVRYAQTDPERSKSYSTTLIDRQAWKNVQRAATRLRADNPERARELEGLVPTPPA